MSNHIKIQGISPRIQYVADGKLNAYEFPFVIFNPSDINVYFNDKVQDSDTYTVAISKNTEGGEVSFETSPASGTIITIVRNLAIKRTTTFQEGGALRAKVLNNEFDYQMACQQQIADSLNRSIIAFGGTIPIHLNRFSGFNFFSEFMNGQIWSLTRAINRKKTQCNNIQVIQMMPSIFNHNPTI